MSHAANLRKYRPQQSVLPAKRRRLSPSNPTSSSSSSSSALHKSNGVSNLAQPPFSDAKLSAVPTRDLKATENRHRDESKVTVRQADDGNDVDMASVSSDQDDDDDDDDDQQGEEDDSSDSEAGDSDVNGEAAEQSPDDSQASSDGEAEQKQPRESKGKQIQDKEAADLDATEEPSFGDLLQARAPETITVEVPAMDAPIASTSLVGPSANRALSVPSANSLGTVLSQALKTNDVDLLESCLHVPNLESIRATIERIRPAQATTLLQRLAERLHKRPGRAGSLMVWVQWTLVAHGGYLASQPAAMRELRTLYQVVKQRAAGLQPLLALKGKLDMLEAQMQLRRNMQARSRAARRGEEEEGIIYVEGEESSSSDSEDEEGETKPGKRGKSHKTEKSAPSKRLVNATSDNESGDEITPRPLANGVGGSDVDEDEDGDEGEYDSEDEDGFIDDEAEETGDDSDALSDEIDYDDVDGDGIIGSGSEDEDDEEDRPEPPSKRSKTTKASSSSKLKR